MPREVPMAQRRRRGDAPEFKAEAVRLVRTSTTPKTIARDLGVSVSQPPTPLTTNPPPANLRPTTWVQRRDETVQHLAHLLGMLSQRLIVRFSQQTDSPRDLQLHFYLALRSRGHVEMVQKGASALPSPALSDVRGDRHAGATNLGRQAKAFVG